MMRNDRREALFNTWQLKMIGVLPQVWQVILKCPQEPLENMSMK